MKPFKYVSLFSGIEAASVAWRPLGWIPVAFSEIDPFAKAVLATHFPSVPNLGDVTKVSWEKYRGKVDLVVGGSPCQSFSIAGRHEGMAGLSGLVREYIRALEEIHPTFFVWENVPGIFHVDGGKTFPEILKAWDNLGYHVAWRVLDAEYFGVPQRRCRVFAVGHSGNWRYPAAVLFEPQSLRWNTETSGTKAEDTAGAFEKSVEKTGWYRMKSFGDYVRDKKASALKARDYKDSTDLICSRVAPCISASGPPYSRTGNERVEADALVYDYAVRRITPLECERLQGFPDNYTAIEYKWKGCVVPDSFRYKALGNSMAVPCMRWIGERIDMIRRITAEEE